MTTDPRPMVVVPENLRSRAGECAVLIVTAGFEARARRVVETLNGTYPERVILVRYPKGIKENDATFEAMNAAFHGMRDPGNVVTVTLNARRPDEFIESLKHVLSRWRPDATGEVWIDVTPLPMQGICAALTAIREVLPGLTVRVLYTEALEYYPTRRQIAESGSRAALSQEMAGNLIPKHFSGSSSEAATCLIVFAGYEKHRSVGVVDELNPARLVLVFGRPKREDLLWRLEWSRRLHQPIPSTRPTASEVVSTLDPWDSLRLLNRYYTFLFADHNIAISPICSKMQCVATYMFWERHRDVQLVFPLPVSYLPQQFSRRHGDMFEFVLPSASELSVLQAAPL